MPSWMVVAFSVLGSLVLIGGVVFTAFRPSLQARPGRSWLPPPSGAIDTGPSVGDIGPHQ